MYLILVMPGGEMLAVRHFFAPIRDTRGRIRQGIGTPRFLFLPRVRQGFLDDVFGDG